jgi:hypothetical protein
MSRPVRGSLSASSRSDLTDPHSRFAFPSTSPFPSPPPLARSLSARSPPVHHTRRPHCCRRNLRPRPRHPSLQNRGGSHRPRQLIRVRTRRCRALQGRRPDWSCIKLIGCWNGLDQVSCCVVGWRREQDGRADPLNFFRSANTPSPPSMSFSIAYSHVWLIFSLSSNVPFGGYKTSGWGRELGSCEGSTPNLPIFTAVLTPLSLVQTVWRSTSM